MRNHIAFWIIFASSLTSPLAAQSKIVEIESHEGMNYLGRTVTLEMPVRSMEVGGDDGTVVILKSQIDGLQPGTFRINLTKEAQAEFGEPVFSEMVKRFSGKQVRVKGTVSAAYLKGQKFPKIVVRSQGNVEVLGAAILQAPQSQNAGPETACMRYHQWPNFIGKTRRIRTFVWMARRVPSGLVLTKKSTAPADFWVHLSKGVVEQLAAKGVKDINRYFQARTIEVTGEISSLQKDDGTAFPVVTPKSAEDIVEVFDIKPDQWRDFVDKTVCVEMAVQKFWDNESGVVLSQNRTTRNGTPGFAIQLNGNVLAEMAAGIGKHSTGKEFLGKTVKATGKIHIQEKNGRKFPMMALQGAADIREVPGVGNPANPPAKPQVAANERPMMAPQVAVNVNINNEVKSIITGPNKGMALEKKELQAVDKAKPENKAKAGLPNLSQLVNRCVDLYMRDGRILGDVLITALEVGTLPESITSLKAKIGDLRPRLYKARMIKDIAVDGMRLSLKYDRGEEALVVDQAARHQRHQSDLANEKRLATTGKKLWERLTDKEHAEWNQKHRAYALAVQQQYPKLALRVVETKYYLIVTDIPVAEVNQYVAYLDKLYDEMCRAFGIPQGYNIWCGKCVIVAFQNRPDFIRFEVEMMENNENARQSGGLCHAQSSGRVLISLFKKDFKERFATVLVHETSHGMIARFLSNAGVPSWLNEGMAVWIAEYIVPRDTTLEKSQKASVAALRAQGTLAGFFESQKTPGDLYGCASAMVGILLELDRLKFRQFVTDIKLGHTQDVSLKKNYNMTFEDLTKEYGRRIGIPQLRP